MISKSDCKEIGIILDRITGPSDPEVFADQASDLSSAMETVLFLGFLFLQTDLFLEAGILDDLVRKRVFRTCACEKGLSWQQVFFMRVIKFVSGSLVLLAPE